MALRLISCVGLIPSKTSEVCFSQLPFAGFKEATLYLPSML